MEIPFIPKDTLQKAEDPAKLQQISNRKAAAAYNKPAEGGDVVTISPKSRLLQNLRSQYADLEKEQEAKVETLKANAEIVEMSTEDIVTGILRGTLFDAI